MTAIFYDHCTFLEHLASNRQGACQATGFPMFFLPVDRPELFGSEGDDAFVGLAQRLLYREYAVTVKKIKDKGESDGTHVAKAGHALDGFIPQ